MTSSTQDIAIVGIGMHPFGRHDGVSGRQQGVHAARAALRDAGIIWPDIEFAVGGSAAAGPPDTMVSDLGLTGVPFVNVSNGCATGGTALLTAMAAISSGAVRNAMAVGFDKHPRGAFNADPASHGIGAWYGETGMMLTTQFFALKIQRYLHEHGIESGVLARIAEKAYRNGAQNPNAWRTQTVTAEEIAASPMLSDPLTKLMFCSPGEGGVALVLCAAEDASKYPGTPVFLRSAVMKTRQFGSFEVFSPWLSPERGSSPSEDAARAAFEEAGVDPADVDVAQIQDTESGAELMHMAETGLCKHGEQEALLARGGTEIGGELPINTDGGCIANGEPIGASGLRQIYENVLQLRGAAGPRQVPGEPRTAFSHVYGAPGVSACTVMTR